VTRQHGSLFAFLLLAAIGANAQDVRLDLQTTKTQFLLGEPVVVYLSLENLSIPNLELPVYLAPEFGEISFEITDPANNVREYNGWNRTCAAEPFATTSPGHVVYGVSRLFFDGHTWLFDQVGSYTVKAIYAKGKCTDEVTIQVTTPSDAQAVSALMNDYDAAKYLLFNGGDHLTSGIATLSQIATDAEAGHGAHINLAFGQAYLESFANFVAGRLRAADPALAVTYLETARTDPAGLYTQVMAHTMLAEAYDALGDTKTATTRRNELKAIVEGSYPSFQPWVDHLIAERAARAAAKADR